MAAAREEIWPLIFDPSTLMQLLPGCDEVQQVAEGEYTARLSLRVPALAGEYAAHVWVEQADPGRFCRLSGEADGPAGSLRGSAQFTLAAEGPDTRIHYQGDAVISGPLAGMNARFAEGVAKTLVNQGLAKLPVLAAARALQQAAAPEAAAERVRTPESTISKGRALLVELLALLRAWVRLLLVRRQR